MRQKTRRELVIYCIGTGYIPPTHPDVKFLLSPPRPALTRERVLIVVPIERLSEVIPLAQSANELALMKALLIYDSEAGRLLPQILHKKAIRLAHNILVYQHRSVADRVIRAWTSGSERELIADARIVGDHLFVVACSMEVFDVPCSTINALHRMSPSERAAFTIDTDGAFIHWDYSDVDLDIEAFRMTTDPIYQERVRVNHLKQCKAFGSAVQTLRKKAGLRQSDIPELSERQVRRIEQGERAGMNALKRLAVAHKMVLPDYLNRLAELANPS